MKTYSQTLVFVFKIEAGARALRFVIALEFLAVAFFFPAIAFALGVFFDEYQFTIEKFHFAATLVLGFKHLKSR